MIKITLKLKSSVNVLGVTMKIDREDYLFVMAPSMVQAVEFAKRYDVRLDRLQYIARVNDLRGVSGDGRMLWVCNGSWSRPDSDEIFLTAKARRFAFISEDEAE
jgi:hypothetical protein